MNYYPFHVGDYAAATRHLSMLEHGAYRLLIDLYCLREGPLPADLAAVQRLVCARSSEERTAVETVLAEFFVLGPDGWRNKRCDEEIERYQAKSDKARESAGKRWRGAGGANAETLNPSRMEVPAREEGARDPDRPVDPSSVPVDESGGNASAMRTHSDRNAKAMLTNNQEPIETPPYPPAGRGGGAEDRFSDFWRAWPPGERKQDKAKCFDLWRRRRLDAVADVILADVDVKATTRKWRDGFVEAPLVYLRGRRWEDGVVPDGGPAADLADLLIDEAA